MDETFHKIVILRNMILSTRIYKRMHILSNKIQNIFKMMKESNIFGITFKAAHSYITRVLLYLM